jgi:hypothetical protein
VADTSSARTPGGQRQPALLRCCPPSTSPRYRSCAEGAEARGCWRGERLWSGAYLR